MLLRLALTLFLVVLAIATATGDRCIQLRVRPTAMLQRGDVDVQIRIPPHDDHYAFSVTWDSETGDHAGSSGPTRIDGRTLFVIPGLRDFPPQHYVFVVQLYDRMGHVLASDRAEIRRPGDDSQ